MQWQYVNWHGVHDIASSRQCCLLMLEAMRLRPSAKILNDNSNIIRTSVHLTEWSLQWLASMHEAGLHYLAWVYAAEFPERQSTEAIVKYMARPTVASFDDVATAYNWLLRQHVSPRP
ncbi:hypothetical protein LF252_10565 [Hymenobacter sp. BT728]|nr:hypothetical protein [Hymenobacter pini]